MATDLIADALAARRDELVAAAVDVYVARIGAYREAAPALLEDARAHTRTHHDLLCDVLRRDSPVRERELDFVERHAARRARGGIELADFLEAFRSYHNILWDAVLETSRESRRAADQALAAARTVIGYVDLAATRASAAYLDAQQLLLANRDRVQRDLLEDLLDAGAPRTAAGLAAARAAGLESDAACVLVAAVPVDTPDDDDTLPRAARALAAAARGRSVAAPPFRRGHSKPPARSGRAGAATPAPGDLYEPLAVTRRGEIVLVRACAPGERVALRMPLLEACASQPVVLAVGVSTVHDGLAEVGAAYREASQALTRVADSGGVLSLPDLSAFDYLTLRGDDVARRLIAPEIERFVAEDRAHGGQLIETLLAYADADLNAKAAAETLLIHVNTAHYRLGRIAEKTGCDLRRLTDVIDLLIAVRLADR